jgi:hypothetical protein
MCVKPLSHSQLFLALLARPGLMETGTLTIGSGTIGYTYNASSSNLNARTLQYFSTTANTKMRHNEDATQAFYPDFQKFLTYYGEANVDYANKIVEAAFDAGKVTLGDKNLDFSGYDYESRTGKWWMTNHCARKTPEDSTYLAFILC